MRRVISLFCLCLALAGPLAASALAQPPASPPAATDEFVPVTDLPPSEQMPAAPLVIGAYAFIWVALLVYVAMLWRRVGALQKDLDALHRTPR